MKDFISPDLFILIGCLIVFLLVIGLYIWGIGREDRRQRERLRTAGMWWQKADKTEPKPTPCTDCSKMLSLGESWYYPLKKGPLCEDCYWKAKLTPITKTANLRRSPGHQFDRTYSHANGHTTVDIGDDGMASLALAAAMQDSYSPPADTGSSLPSDSFTGGGGDFGGGGSSSDW